MISNASEKILICDDYPICCFGIKAAIEMIPDGHKREYFFAHNGHDAIALTGKHRFNYIFMDLKLPDLTGFETIRLMLPNVGSAKIIAMTGFTDTPAIDGIKTALENLPLHAVILKNQSAEAFGQLFEILAQSGNEPFVSPEIASRILQVGKSPLTKRENEVIRYVVKGMTTKEIAEKLSCSQETVKSHRANILAKLDVRNVAELAAWYSDRYGKSDLGS